MELIIAGIFVVAVAAFLIFRKKSEPQETTASVPYKVETPEPTPVVAEPTPVVEVAPIAEAIPVVAEAPAKKKPAAKKAPAAKKPRAPKAPK